MKAKILFFMIKIENIRKIVLSVMFFVIEFFLTIASYKLFRKHWIFMNQSLFCGENILYKSTISNFENKVFSG